MASEVVADATERVWQFANWLAVQPQTGMRHMLQLTLKAAAEPEAPAAAAAKVTDMMPQQALPTSGDVSGVSTGTGRPVAVSASSAASSTARAREEMVPQNSR